MLDYFTLKKRVFTKEVVWVHNASVGELIASLPLIKFLARDYHVIVTVTTLTSAEVCLSNPIDDTECRFFPLDIPVLIRLFLKVFSPKFCVVIESELWPNFISTVGGSIPMILVNARISDSTFKKWGRHKAAFRRMLSYFSLILPTSLQDLERFAMFVDSDKIGYVGNIKYASPALPACVVEIGRLRGMIGTRPVLLIVSTHYGEEEILLNVYRKLLQDCPELLMVIAPRHAKRAEEIAKVAAGFNCSFRSKSEVISEDTQIYLADTMGELGIFFSLADVVFVGGSMVNWGGHNILEPMRFAKPVVIGPYMHNFRDLADEAVLSKAVIQVGKEADLYEAIKRLLTDKQYAEKFSRRGEEFSSTNDSILTEIIEKINEELE